MAATRLLLTCGLPGSGKTTLAKRLAADRRAVRLTKDEWLWALGTTPWDASAGERVERQLVRLAEEALVLDLNVVLDFGLWERAARDAMRSIARDAGVGVELHYLDVRVDVLWRRLQKRNEHPPWNACPIRRTDLDGWAERFEAPDGAELALYDRPPG